MSATRSIRSVYSIRPMSLLTIFPLVLLLLSSIYNSIPPAISTLFENRRCIRTAIARQRLHFVLFVILIFARGVVSLACSAAGDLFPRVATLDVKDGVPCAHFCVEGNSSRAAFSDIVVDELWLVDDLWPVACLYKSLL